MTLPYITSILSDLSVFDSLFQNSIVEIYSQINIFNEEIEIARYYYQLTFNPSCMDVNKDIINGNLKDCYNNIQNRVRLIVDKINIILED